MRIPSGLIAPIQAAAKKISPPILMRRCVLAVATLAISGSAQAELVTVTWGGVLGAGSYDVAGAFGATGANLSGDSFTAVLTFDNSDPSYNTPYTGATSGTTSQYFQNTNTFGPPNSASFTVNGVTLNFSTAMSCVWCGASRSEPQSQRARVGMALHPNTSLGPLSLCGLHRGCFFRTRHATMR